MLTLQKYNRCTSVVNLSKLSMSDPLNHLGSIWYYSKPLKVPYSPNQSLGWDFFYPFLQQTGSSKWFGEHGKTFLKNGISQWIFSFKPSSRVASGNSEFSFFIKKSWKFTLECGMMIKENTEVSVFQYVFEIRIISISIWKSKY